MCVGVSVWLGWSGIRIAGFSLRLARHHPHRTHDLHNGSQDHHPSTKSVQKTTCCNSTSNAPDDGRMRPKHVELRIRQLNYLVVSSWHFTLFHEEEARSNNPQVPLRHINFWQAQLPCTANSFSDIVEFPEFEAIVQVNEIQRSLRRDGENSTVYLILFHPVEIYFDTAVAWWLRSLNLEALGRNGWSISAHSVDRLWKPPPPKKKLLS